MSNNPDNIRKAIEAIINTRTEQDGLKFLKETIHISDITPNAKYDGRRVGIVCRLGVMKIPIQIDIGFGDTIFPTPVEMQLPRVLDFDSASILCYSPETSIAEKAHAMLDRGVLNSRMKDFYDVWILSESIELREEILAKAISKTFSTRKTVIDTESIVFTEAFFHDENKQKQWSAFLRKRNIFKAPEHFHNIARDVMGFLKPVLIKAKLEY
ncbi:nucleotidyl transferase AbiEii/AbiGii toxin family protein [bacterium]|nr:nucleotidyl transferase AbiEii/AbiGii toxin family protein [bacterium]